MQRQLRTLGSTPNSMVIINSVGTSCAIAAGQLPGPNRAIGNNTVGILPNNGNTGRTSTTTHLNIGIRLLNTINRSSGTSFLLNGLSRTNISATSVLRIRNPDNAAMVAIDTRNRGAVICSPNSGTGTDTNCIRSRHAAVTRYTMLKLYLRDPVPAIVTTTRATRSTNIAILLGSSPFVSRLPRRLIRTASVLLIGRRRTTRLLNLPSNSVRSLS